MPVPLFLTHRRFLLCFLLSFPLLSFASLFLSFLLSVLPTLRPSYLPSCLPSFLNSVPLHSRLPFVLPPLHPSFYFPPTFFFPLILFSLFSKGQNWKRAKAAGGSSTNQISSCQVETSDSWFESPGKTSRWCGNVFAGLIAEVSGMVLLFFTVRCSVCSSFGQPVWYFCDCNIRQHESDRIGQRSTGLKANETRKTLFWPQFGVAPVVCNYDSHSHLHRWKRALPRERVWTTNCKRFDYKYKAFKWI